MNFGQCRIHCTSIGKYISKEVLCSAYPGTIYDDSGVETFDLPGQPDLILGRCFIEVCKIENLMILRKLVVCVGKMINTVTCDIYRWKTGSGVTASL